MAVAASDPATATPRDQATTTPSDQRATRSATGRTVIIPAGHAVAVPRTRSAVMFREDPRAAILAGGLAIAEALGRRP